jgi:hypothetical protein
MGNERWFEIEYFHGVAGPESKQLKATALNLWEASPLSFDRALPGKPPTRPPLLFSEGLFFHITTQPSRGGDEGEGESSKFN